MVRRGALIVFEGLDRSGKSTQAKRLMDKINTSGGSAIILPFPGMLCLHLGSVMAEYSFEQYC